uniref:Uncharacterized protein n=1 Tax=Arundo donax TaxID=35708 RepID=A0A0A9AEY5_ARUDO
MIIISISMSQIQHDATSQHAVLITVRDGNSN